MTTVLLDAGPLVAWLDSRDRYHRWATEQLARFQRPLITCEPVLTEACYLVRRQPDGPAAVLRLLKQDVMAIALNVQSEQDRITTLLRDYADLSMSLADACLVRMSELHPDSMVFTIDSDFHHYRRHRRQKIPLLTPPDH